MDSHFLARRIHSLTEGVTHNNYWIAKKLIFSKSQNNLNNVRGKKRSVEHFVSSLSFP